MNSHTYVPWTQIRPVHFRLVSTFCQMKLKQRLAYWLQRFPPLRWGLALGVRLLVPQHLVGAVGVVFNDAGEILLIEHVFRPYFPWGLPGGWIERGEDPADAVRREIEEEVRLQVEVKELLFCKAQGTRPNDGVPLGLGLAYYCRLADNVSKPERLAQADHGYEVLSTRWIEPARIEWKLARLEEEAIALAQQAFERELDPTK